MQLLVADNSACAANISIANDGWELMENLETADVSGNLLYGSLPQALITHAQHLTVLDVHNNMLSGIMSEGGKVISVVIVSRCPPVINDISLACNLLIHVQSTL